MKLQRSHRGLRLGLGVLLLAGLLGGCVEETGALAPAPESQASTAGFDAAAAARLGEGFLVWESNRSGPWRLWTRRLDGSGLRQLTPDEPGRQHCCGHISPNGEWVTYLSLKGGRKEYVGGTETGELRLLRIDGLEERMLAPRARTHNENRAVVWMNDEELIHLTEDGRTVGVDIETGAQRMLIDQPMEGSGWLLNSDLTFATRGFPSFSVHDGGTIAAQAPVSGCQPYFSHDGRWGFWTGGAGGPIYRVELASGNVTTLLRKNDSRLPAERGYVYFPMASRDGRLFAVGASKGRHDHFEADYEIFIFASDPRTLEPEGESVRFTFDRGVDRYPDVWSEPLELGDHAGEAPFEIEFDLPEGVPDGEGWRWTFGDGASAEGSRVMHRWERSGVFRVVASSGRRERVGMVRISTTEPPGVLRSELRDGGREVRIWFDELVDLSGATARFESGSEIESSKPSQEGRSLLLRLAEPLTRVDRVVLTGVADRAQIANVADELSVTIEPPIWPVSEEGLLLLWQTADAANLLRDPLSDVESSPVLRAQGRATFDHAHALALAGGDFIAERENARMLIQGFQRANEITIETTVRSDRARQEGVVVSLGGPSRRDVIIRQRGDSLWFELRSRRNRSRTWSPEAKLFKIKDDRAVHVVVTYRPGQLRAYRDGVLMTDSDTIQGDFFHWEKGDLVLGADWRGSIEGLALYSRVLSADEIHENAERYAALRAQRSPVARIVAEATRIRASSRTNLAEISPYREALVVNEYQVNRVISGQLEGDLVRVAEWAILGGEVQPATEGRVRLVLERFAENPQLEGQVVLDELAGSVGELFYAIP
jgi:hypothetical protein